MQAQPPAHSEAPRLADTYHTLKAKGPSGTPMAMHDHTILTHAGSAESWAGSFPDHRDNWPPAPTTTHAHNASDDHHERFPPGTGTADQAAGLHVQAAPPPCPSHFRPLPMVRMAGGGAEKGGGLRVAALEDPGSMWPRPADPDHAEDVAAAAAGSNVSIAQFEFRMLKFLKPSRMVRFPSMHDLDGLAQAWWP